MKLHIPSLPVGRDFDEVSINFRSAKFYFNLSIAFHKVFHTEFDRFFNACIENLNTNAKERWNSLLRNRIEFKKIKLKKNNQNYNTLNGNKNMSLYFFKCMLSKKHCK